MLNAILGILIQEIIEAVQRAVSDYFKLRKMREEDKETIDEAIKVPDPAARARNIRNLLQ